MNRFKPATLLLIPAALFVAGLMMPQGLNQSGGAGTNVSITNTPAVTQSGTWTVQPGNTANSTAWKVDGSAVTQPVSGTVSVSALPTGGNLIGFIKQRPVGCTTAGTSDVLHDITQVATGAGSSVSAVTGCVEECYVNSIVNTPVTLRAQDKAGTPVIWVGGAADFTIPANSNMGCGGNGGLNIAGITFTSGMTLIAGTANALNFHLMMRE